MVVFLGHKSMNYSSYCEKLFTSDKNERFFLANTTQRNILDSDIFLLFKKNKKITDALIKNIIHNVKLKKIYS